MKTDGKLKQCCICLLVNLYLTTLVWNGSCLTAIISLFFVMHISGQTSFLFVGFSHINLFSAWIK